jgi:peptidoglycan/LPS O-acetylase OafA/YrhL
METATQKKELEVKSRIAGFDVLKFILAVLVVARHAVQGYYPPDSAVYLIIVNWLSNLAVPVFFMISGYLFIRKTGLNDIKTSAIFKFALRILTLYIIWSAVYFPTTLYTWLTDDQSIMRNIIAYLQSFLFASDVVQLWFLPALAFSVAAVSFALKSGIRLKAILAVSFFLYIVGTICDNGALRNAIPYAVKASDAYSSIFMTTRNGLFYGVFFTALGMYCAQARKQTSTANMTVLFLLSAACMLVEAVLLHSVNMLFFAVPAAYAIFRLSERLQLSGRNETYETLRSCSSVMYYSHALILLGIHLALRTLQASVGSILIILAAILISAAVSYSVVLLQKLRVLRWLRFLY